MKLRNIFTALTAAALALVGCQKGSEFLDEVQVSKSFVSLPVEGGEASVTVTATAEWAFETTDVWPEVIVRDKEGNVTSSTPSWLSVDLASGAKGQTVVTFSAEATTETREVMMLLTCAGVQQHIKVLQMAEKVETPISTCAEVNNNGVDGKVYRVKGAVTSIANTQYGNWYLTDETGTVYIYGTLYNGATQQFTKLGLEVGDIVTVEGPRKNYNGTIELVDVTVLEIEKSLLKLEKMISTPLPQDGGVATALLTVKDGEFSVEIPEDVDWLTASEPTNLGGLVCVELTATANAGGNRKTTVTFKTAVGEKEYVVATDVEQEGAIPQLSVAEAIQLPADSWFAVAGTVTGVHKKGFIVTDAAGDAIYAYANTSEAELGTTLGDNVVVTGKLSSYANFYQIAEPKVEVVSSGNKVTYGAPVVLESAASFEAYKTGTFSAVYVEATGVPTGDYGDIVIGDWTVSPYQTSATIDMASLKDKNVKVKGYLLQYKSPSTLRIMVTSIKEETGVVPTIAEVIAAGAASEAETKGVVVATYTRGALINDGTASILLYNNAPLDVAVGDEVKVAGTTTMYAGMLQFAKDGLVVTKLSSGNAVNHPAPTVLDAAGMDAQLAKTAVEYIEYVGTLSVSGNYYNVNIDGATTAIGSLQYIDAAAHPAAVHGAKIKVRGYFIGVSSSKYVNTMTVSVEAAE